MSLGGEGNWLHLLKGGVLRKLQVYLKTTTCFCCEISRGLCVLGPSVYDLQESGCCFVQHCRNPESDRMFANVSKHTFKRARLQCSPQRF